jgi:NADPH:quinone reductase-like Zn-dependent oxidoreductase
VRAFAIPDFNGSGSVVERPKPVPGEGQILVRVHAAGVNPMDPVLVAGYMRQMVEHRLPLIPGFDYAGVIEGVGPGVDDDRVGQEVFGAVGTPVFGEGSWAEYVVASAALAQLRPPGVTAEQAAAMPLAGGEAIALLDAIDAKEGDTLLVVGAAGGVGTFVVQLAVRMGVTVLAATRGGTAEFVRGLGAAEVFESGEGLVNTVRSRYPDGVSAVIDTFHDAEGLRAIAPVVRSGGWIVSPKAQGAESVLGEFPISFALVSASLSRVGELAEKAVNGEIRVPVEVVPLDDAGRALQAIGSAGVRGKLVIGVE